jgi:hypothetical protein
MEVFMTTMWFVQGELGDPEARLLRKTDMRHEVWNAVEGRWAATLRLLGSKLGEEAEEIIQVEERTAKAHFPDAFHPAYYSMGDDTLLVRGPDGSYLWSGRHWVRDLMVSVKGLRPLDVEAARQRWPEAFIRERSQRRPA